MAVLYRTNPFRILGLSTGADAQTVRNAYRQRVKACHPDRFADPEQQKKAQEQLVELNLAYEEALKQASQRRVGFNQIPLGEAKHFAKRPVERDHEWFYLHGSIMMGLRRYEEAHASFREAIKDEPDNREYRAQALEAALAMKNCHKLDFKVKAWFQDTFKKR